MDDLFVEPMAKSAVISECSKYRYELGRRWADGPTLVLVMLNPSVADAEIDDPTITRQIERAGRLGYGSLHVVNLFAGRATDPIDMKRMADPVGPRNDEHLCAALDIAKSSGAPVLVGWGKDGGHLSRANKFNNMAQQARAKLVCLGTTKAGQPRHPLYMAYDLPLIPWSAP